MEQIRPCGSDWAYCDGNCETCTFMQKVVVTDHTERTDRRIYWSDKTDG